VSRATEDVQSAKQIVAGLQEEFQNAPASQRPFLLQQIRDAEQDEAAAEQRLADAKQALSACLERHSPPRRHPLPVAVG
jgi:hypothetical protein